jgi:L,D-peptidoglycan transpeptidase YkuD (ErfK/YbiS/YcfS/YnhG family)
MNKVLHSVCLLAICFVAKHCLAKSEHDILNDSQQLVLVRVTDWQTNTGKLQRFERVDGVWQALAEPFAVSIGKNGSAWGLGVHPAQAVGPQKVEGDGKAPAGIFSIGTSFGYAPTLSTKLNYQAMTDTDWCVDVNESPLYNQIVSTKTVGIQAVEGSSEPMRRDLQLNGDQLYQNGFVIQHNPNNIPKAGSCIFAHLWRAPGKPTAGCTAMDSASMDALLQWLDADKHPYFVLLPLDQYHQLQKPWHLPKLKDSL